MKRFKLFALQLLSMALLFFMAGCSGNAGTPEPSDTSQSSGNDEGGIYYALPDEPGERVTSEEHDFYVQTVVEDLDIPWGMAFLPNGSMLITERDGTLRLVNDGELVAEPVGGVPEVFARNQGGLLDITLHPEYENNGWIYMSYSKPDNNTGMTAIVRAKYDSDNHTLVDMEELYVGQPFTDRGHHFGGRLAFDPEGYLYFAIGDRGEMNTAQDVSTSQGNFFRFYDDGSIPDDNPFVGEDGLDEIYSYGHRNIQGMAVHPETGVIWTTEHGPRGGDEINVQNKPGANYGWPEITYGINYDGTIITEETEKEGMEQPVMYWDPRL